MTALIDLKPELRRGADTGKPYDEVQYLCPKCRRHPIFTAFHAGEPTTVEAVPLWSATFEEGRVLQTLTLRPSVNREGLTPPDRCGGWHGFITNGEAR